MEIRIPKTGVEWTALITGLGFVVSGLGFTLPSYNRAEANKEDKFRCVDELEEEKQEVAEWKARWFKHQHRVHLPQ